MNAAELAEALGGKREGQKGEWKACCPAHDDRTPSLSICDGDNGKLLVHCHAGCSQDTVIAALREKGLWNGRASAADTAAPRSSAAAAGAAWPAWEAKTGLPRSVWEAAGVTYDHARGALVFGWAGLGAMKLRPWPILKRRAKDTPKYYWTPDDGPRPPFWPLPGKVNVSEQLLLTAGETDRMVAHHAGYDVLAVTKGEGTALPVAALRLLRQLGVREVVVVFDLDAAGIEGAKKAATACVAAGLAVRTVTLPDGLAAAGGKDLCDLWHLSGHDVARFRAALDAAIADAPARPGDPAAQASGADAPGDATGAEAAGVTPLDGVTAEAVTWLWRGRIPRRKLTVLDGDPGRSKTTIALDIAARISAGLPMPDGTLSDLGGPANVVIITAEDDLADTVVPRLKAAGADLSRIVAIEHVPDDDGEGHHLLTLPGDAEYLRSVVERHQAALLILDPLVAFLSERNDAHHDQQVRRALAPLTELCHATGAAVLVIRHLNKSGGGNPLYRGSGSIGIIGAARSGLVALDDPDDQSDSRRILAGTKSNLGPPPASLVYHVDPTPEGVARIAWDGEDQRTASQLFEAQALDAEERSALKEAADWLHGMLEGGPAYSEDVKAAADVEKIARATLRRAREHLRVIVEKEHGQNGRWAWRLRENSSSLGAPDGQDALHGQDEHLEQVQGPMDGPIAHEDAQGVQGEHVEQHAQPGHDSRSRYDPLARAASVACRKPGCKGTYALRWSKPGHRFVTARCTSCGHEVPDMDTHQPHIAKQLWPESQATSAG